MTLARVDVVTFGCRLNIVESEAMRRQALAAGHRDLTVVNTCAVTAEAARQSRQAVRRAARRHPDARLVVTGCAAEIDRDAFARMPGVSAILSNSTKTAATAWARDGSPETGAPNVDLDFSPHGDALHSRGFVEIQNGCDHRCTFCVIPHGRGSSRSVPVDQVVARIRGLVARGAREIVLTGVDVTSYDGGPASPTGLGRLVQRILRDVPELPRLRLSSLDCVEADAALLEAFASESRLMPHLHLSLQSGSDLILKRMRRRHTRRHAIDFCAEMRRMRPETVFGADLIAGFPTEDAAMFADTVELIEACGVTYVHAFPFSPRPNTPAARMPAVPSDVARERARILRTEGDRRLAEHLDRQVGRTLDVLTERGGKGRAADFTLVTLPDNPPPGLLQPALISGHDGRTLLGRLIAR